MSFGSLSNFNPYGDMAGASACPYGELELMAPPTGYGYGTTPSQAAWYSYQAGLAGWGDHGEMGAFWDFLQRDEKKVEKRRAERGERREKRWARRAKAQERRAEAKEKRDVFRAPAKARREAAKEKRQARRAKTKAARRATQYRTVRGDGGYVYRQDGNNCYTILKSPRKRGSRAAGKRICKGDKYWSSIHGEILADFGPFSPSSTASDWAKLATAGGGIGLDLVRLFKGRGDTYEPDIDTGLPPGNGAAEGIPKSALYIGGGILGLVLLMSLMKR